MLPPLVERGRVQPCADLRSCGEFVCPWEELYGAGCGGHGQRHLMCLHCVLQKRLQGVFGCSTCVFAPLLCWPMPPCLGLYCIRVEQQQLVLWVAHLNRR